MTTPITLPKCPRCGSRLLLEWNIDGLAAFCLCGYRYEKKSNLPWVSKNIDNIPRGKDRWGKREALA